MSRIDLYCVALVLDRWAVGAYQVLTGFVVYLQSLALFVVIPFIKGLYRLPESALRSLAFKLPLVGVAAVFGGTAVVFQLLHRVYRLTVPVEVVAVGCLSALPIFSYLPLIYLAYRNGRQAFVVWVNIGGIAINLVLNLALLPTLVLLGAVIATATAQLLMLAGFLAWDLTASRSSAGSTPNASPYPP